VYRYYSYDHLDFLIVAVVMSHCCRVKSVFITGL
jgi:hypothetical protein